MWVWFLQAPLIGVEYGIRWCMRILRPSTTSGVGFRVLSLLASFGRGVVGCCSLRDVEGSGGAVTVVPIKCSILLRGFLKNFRQKV